MREQNLVADKNTTPSAPHHAQKHRRILFIGESMSIAHVGRPALLARWAQEAGYKVTFACGTAFAEAAIGEGLDPQLIETVDLKKSHTRLDKGQFFYTPEELERYVSAERALIQKVEPDLVVGDFRLTLSISAQLEGVPMLSLINAHWSPSHPCPLPPPRFGLFKYLPLRLGETLVAALRPILFSIFAKALDDLRKKYGLAPLRDFRKLYTAGDACAYLDAPELMPLSPLPDGHFFLGPLVWKPRSLEKPALHDLPPNRPLAYVTMGSSGDEGLLPKILRALADCECNVVLTGIEDSRVQEWLKDVPELKGRLIAKRMMEPRDVLKQAALTICHSGSGTVYQSLLQGVPVLGLPHNPDQGLIAAAVEQSGAGINLHPERATLKRLKKRIEVQFLKSTKMKSAAEKLSLALQAYATRDRWQTWLGAFLDVDASSKAQIPQDRDLHIVSALHRSNRARGLLNTHALVQAPDESLKTQPKAPSTVAAFKL